MDEILLRRTKTTRAEDIQLPPRVVTVRSEKLDVKEEDFYSALYTQSQAQFNTYLQSGTVLNNYAHIFDILIRLRQAVDHPYLVIYSEAQVAKQDDSENYLNLSNSSTNGNGELLVTFYFLMSLSSGSVLVLKACFPIYFCITFLHPTFSQLCRRSEDQDRTQWSERWKL